MNAITHAMCPHLNATLEQTLTIYLIDANNAGVDANIAGVDTLKQYRRRHHHQS